MPQFWVGATAIIQYFADSFYHYYFRTFIFTLFINWISSCFLFQSSQLSFLLLVMLWRGVMWRCNSIVVSWELTLPIFMDFVFSITSVEYISGQLVSWILICPNSLILFLGCPAQWFHSFCQKNKRGPWPPAHPWYWKNLWKDFSEISCVFVYLF